jgi:hypothetical protein
MKSKSIAPIALAFFLAKASAFAAVDLGSETSETPYDPYLRPVKEVLRALSGTTPSLNRVRTLMREGRQFHYSFTNPYVAARPTVTQERKEGDCKAKSLWLCDQLGDFNVRYVIGKSRRNARLSHAWVLWKHEGRWWILDCTNTDRPIPAETISETEYIAIYSYDRRSAYRHAAATSQMVTANAEGKRGPVAARNLQCNANGKLKKR